MNATRRPVSVSIVSCLYIAVGTIGFAYYFPELMAHHDQSVLIELTELLAMVSGAFMLRGLNWARWLALVWMAFHVAISFPVVRQVVNHSIIFALIAWVLFRQDTRRHFNPLEGTNSGTSRSFRVYFDAKSPTRASKPSNS
jgi:hypothetical protein